eukprot:Unigene1742_Nuclearia_a/m.5358 Unigene1742_Nuclearia_a/g.5358  ORF Unigene1742_Nuclearia_a/g.5358 Unigene1742_Nuclearia_a/m.5358 type:complete len:782 (+) Unigene1742_Nuclearia_a:30-2375(+)
MARRATAYFESNARAGVVQQGAIVSVPTLLSSSNSQARVPGRKSTEHVTAAVPKLFVCPITLELMQDPTITTCGHMFEREAIIDWLRGLTASSKVCPICNQPVNEAQLSPCYPIKTAIADWIQHQTIETERLPGAPAGQAAPAAGSDTSRFKLGMQFRKVVANLFRSNSKPKDDEPKLSKSRSRSRSSSVGSLSDNAVVRFPAGDGVVWARLQPLSRSYEPIDINRDSFVIGRSAQADHVLVRSEISGKHCNIYRVAMEPTAYGYKPDGFNWDVFLVDTSSNGTYVNGRRPGKGDPVGLRHGDEISLGNRFTSQEKPELSSFVDWVFLGSLKSSPHYPQIQRLKTAVADFDTLITLGDADLAVRGIEASEVKSKILAAAKSWSDEHQLPVYRYMIVGMDTPNNPPPRRPSNPQSSSLATPASRVPAAPGPPSSTAISYTHYSTHQQQYAVSPPPPLDQPPIMRANSMPVSGTSILPPIVGPPMGAPMVYAPRAATMNAATPAPPPPIVSLPTSAPGSRALPLPTFAEEDFDVGFFPSTYMINPGQATVQLNLRRIGPVSVPLTVYVSTTEDSTARAGVDFVPVKRKSVTFPVGSCDVTYKYNIESTSGADSGPGGVQTINFAVFRSNGELMPVTELTEPTAVLIFERKGGKKEDELAKLQRLSLASTMSGHNEMVERMATVFYDVNLATIQGVVRHEQKAHKDADPSLIQDVVVNKLLWYQSLAEPAPEEVEKMKTIFAETTAAAAATAAGAAAGSSQSSASSADVPRHLRPVGAFTDTSL